MSISPPYPWFGGKAKVVDLVWSRFGVVPNYVEPFFGGGAILLNRPQWTFQADVVPRETINDFDGHVSNFWRACKYDPDGVADAADRPVNELDLHAIGDALFCRPSKTWSMAPTDFVKWVREDEQHFDAKRAGQWAWFVANWIGGLPSMTGSGNKNGDGVFRQRPHLADAGRGVARKTPLMEWMRQLQDRLRYVRVCCGDWSRVTGKSATWNNAAPCAMFFDPPYSDEAGRDNSLYSEECAKVAHDVREWAISEGERKDMRICVCGYDGEHTFPESWDVVAWKTNGGYANRGNNTIGIENIIRERLWFSPHCLRPAEEMMLF